MLVNCQCCNKEFNKAPSQIKKTKNNFCSKSCAASFNNKKTKKRPLTKKCCSCGELIYASRKYCSECNGITNNDKSLATLTYHKGHRSNAFGAIRARARNIAIKAGWTKCCKCGYDKHIEIAHVKSIGEFPPETPIKVINHIDNLLPLCPNCHWEFDNQ